MSWKKTFQTAILSIVVGLGGFPAVALAVCSTGQQTCSSNYAVGEAFFGSGGNLNSCSASYCSKQSAGETAVGNTKSTSYQAQAGFNTNREPYLEFVVSATNINLGVLTPGTAATATASFSVKTYLASGYVVTTASATPTYSTHSLTGLSSPTAFNSANEQFGINLVVNTGCSGLPASLGANPVQVPSGSYSFGAAASGYNTACQFKYVNGDTIASSSSSSGETDYTISYLININKLTPAGQYTMNHVLVASSTF